ncbi:MAG: peptidylprolyl isomerase [Roseibacillus sp.]
MNRSILSSLLFAITPVTGSAQILADFEVKNGEVVFGYFTVLLDHQLSPHAVANFIRLAEGLTPWIDTSSSTGEVKTGPFYDGLTFHAATAGFEVVSGSPGGEGNDGPGWTLRDDFRTAPGQYSVCMENDGPNTNGSRFFINLTTVLNATLRPGNYTPFGVVIGPTNPPGGNGRITVSAISNTAAGFLRIGSVTMRYLGLEAQTFRQNIEEPNHPWLSLLPSAREAVFTFRKSQGSIILDWDTKPGSVALLWGSLDLRNWAGPLYARNVPASTKFGYDLTSTVALQPTGFFRGGVVEYPHWPSTERPLAGIVIETSFFDPAVGSTFSSTYAFDETGTAGVYFGAFGEGDFTVTKSEILGPYSFELELTPLTGGQPVYRFTLHYDLAWNSPQPLTAQPVTANPSRLEGFNLAAPGGPLVGGLWTYLAGP